MTRDEWPYSDADTSDAVMQQWWDENQSVWRYMQSRPSRIERLCQWLTHDHLLDGDYLLDGVPIPEWARAQSQTPSIPWHERGGIP